MVKPFLKTSFKKFNYFGTKGSINKGISDGVSFVSDTSVRGLIHLATIDRYKKTNDLCQLSSQVFPKGVPPHIHQLKNSELPKTKNELLCYKLVQAFVLGVL